MAESAQGLVGTLVRMIFAQPDAELTRAQHAPRYLTVDALLRPPEVRGGPFAKAAGPRRLSTVALLATCCAFAS